jgi:diadenylate cyclase
MPPAALSLPTWVPKLTFTAVIDILAVAFLIYQFIQIVRGRRAATVLGGVLVLIGVYLFAIWARMDLLRSTLAALAPYTAFALIVMFQSEIRRALARLGHGKWFGVRSRLDNREAVEEILLALRHLSEKKIGALIVVEREIGLRTFIESGVPLDALLSRDLLLAIFHPGGPMHDGAVIVQGDRVAAASCFLPLTMNPVAYGKLGTRHRAAIGVTEESDCLAIIVSEETGNVSIAFNGEIEVDSGLERAYERLSRHLGRSDASPLRVVRSRATTKAPAPGQIRKAGGS